MAPPVLETFSFSLVKLGCLVAITSCSLPLWRGMKFSEETSLWEGLWNLCEADRHQGLKCMRYNSRLELPQDLQVSQVLMVICIIITWLGLLLYNIGNKRMSRGSNTNNEEQIKMAASGLFLGAGLLLVVPLFLVTHSVIPGMANSQMVAPGKPEMGASLYLGWLSSLLLLLGGGLLWCQETSNHDQPSPSEGWILQYPA
ncbi:claudin-13-like [Onychomys torridus]|uniref:claudin-13-like n=1 Tax=Onychomys torridus TaxID=38674 RepID=UPI00167F9D7F|nr:claudin-13-like [Onychomys torridus]